MTFKKGSRYVKTRYFKDEGLQDKTFKGTRARNIRKAEGVLEHTLQLGERLDLLALYYYNDDKKWWLILDANPHINNAGDIIVEQYVGETIVIPGI